MSTSSSEAAAALAAMQASQARLALAATCPPQRHLAFGALLGALVATPALPPLYAILVEGVLLVGVPLVIRWDRRRTGMFINGYRAGRTLPITLGMLALFLLLYLCGVWLSRERGIHWAPLPIGGVAAIAAYRASVLWQRIYRRELGLAA